ncbi:MAG TPA: hypothetical protein VFS43_23205 [Polyangiaceae bacterium]|nr:hypothetical protein [Polyangiaceae bacterium]
MLSPKGRGSGTERRRASSGERSEIDRTTSARDVAKAALDRR